MASVAGLVLALGSAGCKDSNGGRGPDDPDATTDDDGGGPSPEAGSPEGGGNNNPDTGTDGGGIDNDAGNDSGTDPDSGGGDGDAGNDAGPTGPTIVDKASIDFGLSDCDGDAPASQTFKITNSGTASVSYTVTLSNSNAFSIDGVQGGTKSGTVNAGAEVSITLNAAKVAKSATAGVAIGATATITTSLPAPNNSFVIPIKVTPRGAHLALSPSNGPDWILVQTGEGPFFEPLSLQNTGNVAAAVTLTQPDLDAFDLFNGTSESELASELNIPAAAANGTAGAQALNAGFKPLTNGAYVSKAQLAVAGAVCNGGTAASITEIPLEGAASNNGLSVQRTPLAARVDCGSPTPPSSTVTLRNYTTAAMTVAVSTLKPDADSPFTLSQSALSLPPGEAKTFTVTVKAAQVPQTATPGTILTDSILVDPSDPAVSQRIFGLTTTIQGAHLVYGHPPDGNNMPTGPFADGAFNGANNLTGVAKNVTVLNTGNLPASPKFTLSPNDLVYEQTGALTPAEVPIGTTNSPGSATIAVTFKPPLNDAARKVATLSIAKGDNDVICGALPTPVTLSGTPSTPGYVLVSADPVQFGNAGAVDCPTPGTPGFGQQFRAPNKTIQIQNTGNTLLTWTATVDTAAFSLSAGTGDIPASTDPLVPAYGTFDVIPAFIPFPPASLDPATYSGNLTITTNIPNDSPHIIPLQQTPHGAVLSVAAGDTAFGEVNVNFVSDPKNVFTITNDGNETGTLTWTGTQNKKAKFTVDSLDISGNGTQNFSKQVTRGTPVVISGSYDPIDGNSYVQGDLGEALAPLVFSSNTALCSALPPNVTLSGTATDEVSFNVPDNLYFAQSPSSPPPGQSAGPSHLCGAPRAEDPKTVFITNYGREPLIIDSIALNSTQWFTAYLGQQGTTSGQVPAATEDPQTMTSSPGVAVAVVVPKTVPASGNNAPSTLDAILTITAHFANTVSIVKTTTVTEFITCTQP